MQHLPPDPDNSFELLGEGEYPKKPPLSETQRQDVGAAGDAESPDAGVMGAHLGPSGIQLNKCLSPGPGGWKDISHLIAIPQVQGHRLQETYLLALLTVERGWVPGLRLWECHYPLGDYGILLSWADHQLRLSLTLSASPGC